MASRPDAPLDLLLTPKPVGPGRFEASFPDGWQQGRGCFGGLVLGTMVRAMEAHLGAADRRLRSLTAELCGPTLPGPARLSVQPIRAGNNVTTLVAHLEQGGSVQAHAVGVFARPRGEPQSVVALSPPAPRPWRATPVLPLDARFSPPFTRYWEFRTDGPLPFAGGREPLAQGWIRPLQAGPVRDAAWAVACADAWWPALFTTERAPRPVGTVSFSFQLVCELEGLGDAPLFFVGRELARHDGYSVESRELWREDGRLLALNQQTVVVIR